MKVKKITTGHKRVKNFFEEIRHQNSFKNAINGLRQKYSIPLNGYPKKDHVVSSMVVPTHKSWNNPINSQINTALKQDVKALAKSYGLHGDNWIEAFKEYLFWNDTLQLNNFLDEFDMCLVEDNKPTKDQKKMYPVVLRISAHAPISNIVDFIETYKDQIIKMQQVHIDDSYLSKVRTKKISNTDRDELIYQNRNLPTKRIARLLSDQMGIYLDQGHIGKIISIQKKRREN